MVDWHELSRSVLGPCLRGNRDDAIEILYTNQVMLNDIANQDPYRDVYLGIIAVLDLPDVQPSPIMVAREYTQLADKVEWLRELASTQVTKAEAIGAVPMLKNTAHRYFVTNLLKKAGKEIDSSDNTQDFVTSLIEELSRGHNNLAVPTTANHIVADILEGISGYGKIIPTSFKWLNYHLKGGLRPGRHIAIGGGEKSRKTTWLRNIIKGVLRNKDGSPNQDVSVLFLAFENDRYITAMDFVAMLAMEYMWAKHQNILNTKFGDPNNPRPDDLYIHQLIDAEILLDAIATDRLDNFPKEIVEAVEYGLRTFADWNIEIKDTTSGGGELETLSTVKRAVNFHNATIRKPGQLLIICTDYLTLVEVDDVHDERIAQNLVVNWLTRKVADLQALAFTVAQFNRANIYGRMSGEEVDVMGTHGSSQLERAVQNYMDVQKTSDTTLKVRMRRARRGAGGLNEEQVYYTHPASGLIMSNQPENWFKLGDVSG